MADFVRIRSASSREDVGRIVAEHHVQVAAAHVAEVSRQQRVNESGDAAAEATATEEEHRRAAGDPESQ